MALELLTILEYFSTSPRASGGPSTPPAGPPGCPGGWRLGLDGSSLLGKAAPPAPPTTPPSGTPTASLAPGKDSPLCCVPGGSLPTSPAAKQGVCAPGTPCGCGVTVRRPPRLRAEWPSGWGLSHDRVGRTLWILRSLSRPVTPRVPSGAAPAPRKSQVHSPAAKRP